MKYLESLKRLNINADKVRAVLLEMKPNEQIELLAFLSAEIIAGQNEPMHAFESFGRMVQVHAQAINTNKGEPKRTMQ